MKNNEAPLTDGEERAVEETEDIRTPEENLSSLNEVGEQDYADEGEDSVADEVAMEGGDEITDLKVKLNEFKKDNAELKEQLLRKQAEFENFRKRIQKDKQDSIRFANQELIRDVLDIMDNMERAIKSSRESEDFSSLASGVEMIERQMNDTLSSRYGLKRMESIGTSYDPNLHEAMMMEESSEYETSVVLEDYQAGYLLHDRVLRPARVKVSKPANHADKEKTNVTGEGRAAQN